MSRTTGTPRAHALPDGACTYRLTPSQVQEMIGAIVANLGQEDLDVLRELSAEREIPGDLTADIGRAAVDSLWSDTLVDAAKSPLLMQVRVRFSPGQVREIAAAGVRTLSEAEFRELCRFETAPVCSCGRCDGSGMLRIHTDGTEERVPCSGAPYNPKVAAGDWWKR